MVEYSKEWLDGKFLLYRHKVITLIDLRGFIDIYIKHHDKN